MQKSSSLSQRNPRIGLPGQLVVGATLLLLPALGVLTAFGIAPDTVATKTAPQLVSEPIELPEPQALPQPGARAAARGDPSQSAP